MELRKQFKRSQQAAFRMALQRVSQIRVRDIQHGIQRPANRVLLCNRVGQMTIEAVVTLPVLITVAIIAINVLMFLGDCAAFDRLSRDAVRSVATAPAYHETSQDTAAQIENDLNQSFASDHTAVHVLVEGRIPGYLSYIAVLEFRPSLFGHALNSTIFGVSLPSVEHRATLTIDPYKPGAII